MTGIVALDLSIAHTGWAIAVDEYGTVETKPKVPVMQRIHQVLDEVRLLVRDGDVVVIEAMFTGGHASSAGDTWMLHGVVRSWLYRHGHPFVLIAPTTLKKYATGKGVATKPDMRVAYLQRYGEDVSNDNACDALWLHSAGRAHYLGENTVPKAHRDALKVVAWPDRPDATT